MSWVLSGILAALLVLVTVVNVVRDPPARQPWTEEALDDLRQR